MKESPINITALSTDTREADEAIAHQWMADSARTATARDFESHMDLISKKVTVRGVLGFDLIQYNDWANQCREDFSSGLIKEVSYRGFKFIVASENRIMFKTLETIKTKDGESKENGVEILIEKEEDNKWRVRQERVLTTEEVEHDKLLEGL